jgi:hypothetical protein
LSAEQKKQLDSIAARAKEMISNNKGDPKSTDQHLVIGAFGDSMDKDPMAAWSSVQAVATYITSKGVRVGYA